MAVTDLTGYTWVGNDSLLLDDEETFDINFICNNNNYDTLEIAAGGDVYYGEDLVYTRDNWQNEAYKTIQITSGTDVTNIALIDWLEKNGTLTAPIVMAGKTQIGTRAITKKMFGTREITKEVVNGVVVYEKQAPTTSYNVAITESNNSQSNLNYKSYLKIYDGQDSTGTLLVNSTGTTLMPQTSVTCTTGYLYLEDCSTLGGGYTQIGARNIVGNITEVDWGGQTSLGNAYMIMKIESDGSFQAWTDYNYD